MKIYYFNGTHWDREWYYPFEAFRTYLVEMADRMLHLLDKQDTLPQFIFDGQTIVLEDILEIHPEWRSRLQNAIGSGRLKVGPWYVMPDEFLVSGEALLRNLSLGSKISESFGHKPWEIGYVCDIFGHIAQLPQIFRGFGMQGIVIWRGVPSETPPYLLWQSPDGTEMKTIHFHSKYGYSEFSLRVRGTKDVPVDENFKKRFLAWLEEARRYWGKNILCTDAQDHAYPPGDMPKIRAILKECCPGAEILHTDLTEVFGNEFKSRKKLPQIKGELVYPAKLFGSGYQIQATLSSRYDVKQANDKCQNKLQWLLEPMLAKKLVQNGKCDPAFLGYAWKHLLQNQAHDSICGCSPDCVHRHMHTRFEEVEQLVEQQMMELNYQDFEEATGAQRWQILHARGLDEEQKTAALFDEDGNYLLRIANPLPYPIDRISEIKIAFPACKPYPKEFSEPFSSERINTFRIYDEQGMEIPYSIRSVRRRQDKILYPGSAAFFDLYTVSLHTKLRPSGITCYAIKSVDGPVRYFDTLRTGLSSASNGIIALEIAEDGTFTVTDLRIKRSYPGQNTYRIDREIGDGWGHCSPKGSAVTIGGKCRAVRITHESQDCVEFEIIREYEIADRLDYAGNVHGSYEGIRESTHCIPFVIRTRVSLSRYSDALEIHTDIDNNLRDARLQLVIPSRLSGNLFISQAFCFIERTAGRALGNATECFAEAEAPEKNFSGIFGKKDSLGGLFFIARAGLHECGSLPEDDSNLTVTLFRTFCRTVERNGEEEGELQQHLHYDYLLKCSSPQDTFADLTHIQQTFQITDFPATLIPQYLAKAATGNQSFVTLSGKLAFSAMKPAESGKRNEIIVRLVNLSEKQEKGMLRFGKAFRKIEQCMLNENIIRPLAATGRKISLSAGPWEITTLKITF